MVGAACYLATTGGQQIIRAGHFGDTRVLLYVYCEVVAIRDLQSGEQLLGDNKTCNPMISFLEAI